MANVLTQKEIDELLNSLTTGGDTSSTVEDEPVGENVQAYDFRTANKFSKEQIRTLDTIFDTFSSLLSTRLTGLMRTLVEVEVASVEEQLFGEFNNSIPLPAIIAVVEVAPLSGTMIFQMSASVVYGIISRLFGGMADYIDASKPFSDIDIAITETILPQCLAIFNTSWEKVAKLNARTQRIETSPQFTQVVPANEPSAIITLNVHMGEVEDIIAICMPHFMIQPIAKKLNSMTWTLAGRDKLPQETVPIMRHQVMETKVQMTARLKPVKVSMRELLLMKKGDILCLDHNINDFVLLDVENKSKFKVVLGVQDDRRVVQIAEIIKERDDVE